MKLGLIFMVVAAGCSAPQDRSAAESLYLAEQLACVEHAQTLEESRSCRARVQALWKDGGR